MSLRAIDPARSRVVLVGTSTYAAATPLLPNVPVVDNNIADLAEVLMDPELGGFDAAHCFVAPPAAGVAQVGDLLMQAAAEGQDLLLFYYSGHGLLGPRRRELYLTLFGTRPDRLAFTALAFDAVRDACLESRAANRVVILDSCFSGRAIGETLTGDEEEVLGQIQVSGTYTLASAPANRSALILPGERHTAFTERLLSLLREGSPSAGEMISLGDIYRHLLARLRDEGLPLPQQRGTETADLLGLVRNRRLPPPVPTVTSVADPPDTADPRSSEWEARWQPDERRRRADAIFDSSIHAAYAMVGRGASASALEAVAKGLARSDPQRAVHLFGEAGSLLMAEPNEGRHLTALAARAVQSNPESALLRDEAERLARSTGRLTWDALAGVAEFMAEGDPQRADRLAATITDKRLKAPALTEIAWRLAHDDPDRAEFLAHSIREKMYKPIAMAYVAREVAKADPHRAVLLLNEAERVACSIRREDYREPAIYQVAKVFALRDPQRAVLISQKTADPVARAWILAGIAAVVARSHPDHGTWLLGEGERIAQSITLERHKASALAEVAMAASTSDPGRASRLLREAEALAQNITGDADREPALVKIAQAAAVSDLARAWRIAHAVTDAARRTELTTHLVAAAPDSDRPEMSVQILDAAESLILDIADGPGKIRALARLALAAMSSNPQHAARLLAEAESLAQGATPTLYTIEALVSVGQAWLNEDWPPHP